MEEASTEKKLQCYHCGEDCDAAAIRLDDKPFCCDGCKMVYQLLNNNGLCTYYDLNSQPGTSQRQLRRSDKFLFLDDPKIREQLTSFSNDSQTHTSFYLPQMHCSSCLWLLENLHRLNPGVISCKVNFTKRETDIVFDHRQVSLRQVAELLTSIGYEPYISLNDLNNTRPRVSKSLIYQVGTAGFCFANIMLLSFPEYLGLEAAEENLHVYFRALNFVLSLPVLFYSAQPFYISAWKSLRHRVLNIDAPIAMAIIMTFARSVYEVFSGTGPGYFDSMTGIVFFMLAGRLLQERTHQRLSFERDYTSYFPVAVTRLNDEKELPAALPDIRPGDTLLIHNEELVPADGIITRGKALIDYSFVTGESLPVQKEVGEIVYAGGRQTAGNIEILVIKEVAQSYLTRLWNRDGSAKKTAQKDDSFIQAPGRYFTWIVFALALAGATYWSFYDAERAWNVVTTVLIVACPCALLLSASFTNGNILRILGRNSFYLRSARTIEDIARINHIVFDKTGTLTTTGKKNLRYHGRTLSRQQLQAVATVAAQSNHPLSRALADHLGRPTTLVVRDFTETRGMGITGTAEHKRIRLGSKAFAGNDGDDFRDGPAVYVSIDNDYYGYFSFYNQYRDTISGLLARLQKSFRLSVVSGDNAGENNRLREMLGHHATLLFHQQPGDKLDYIKKWQAAGDRVMMVGDGLNDGVALRQSDAGIAVTENCNNFTPASDAIIEAKQVTRLYAFIRLCKANRKIIIASFALSIVYNIIGLFFALQGTLSPLVAAILMPSSSLSILLLTFGSSSLAARALKL